MPKTQVSKAKPVAVSTPVIDCETYVTINRIKKGAEKELESLKPRIFDLIPQGQDKERFEAQRDGVPGHYEVSRIEQDRRGIDDDKLALLLRAKGLYVGACKTTPDHDKVAKLIAEGKFEAADLESCMKGSIVIYATCDFKPLK